MKIEYPIHKYSMNYKSFFVVSREVLEDFLLFFNFVDTLVGRDMKDGDAKVQTTNSGRRSTGNFKECHKRSSLCHKF